MSVKRPNDKFSVCVYCGSSINVDSVYHDAARKTGKLLAEADFNVVYGGSSSGLMGLVADAALEAGAHVTGVIPHHIDEREVEHPDLSELHVVDSMHQRKQIMATRADAFVVLPGGLGTLEEFFEIMTWRQLGLHDKPIIVLNKNGYWDSLDVLMRSIRDAGFVKDEHYKLCQVVETEDEVVDILQKAPRNTRELAEEKI